jgi:alpha-glucosidase (family GH31 glycosyl hydrolase)
MPLKAIKLFFILVSAILLPFLTVAQIVTVQPATASLDDTVTITYDASAGNQALLNCNGSVYMHTGVITGKSLDGHDWKHVVGNWGQDDSRVKMISVSKNIWQKKLVIRRFYSLSPDEKVLQLSFVFRNQNGSKVGKTANNDDILVSVNGYTPPVTKAVSYRWKTRNYISHHLSNGVLNIETTHGLVQAIPYSGKIVEIKNFPGSLPEKDTSTAVVLTPQNPNLTMKELPDWLLLKTDSLTVVFHKNPFYATFIYNNDSLLQENYGYFERTDNNGLQFKISENEKLYGLGERAIDFSLTGHRYPLYNRPHFGYELGADQLNYSVPLVVSSKKYLLFFDNPQKGYVDLGATTANQMEWGAMGGVMKYFFVAGTDFKDIATQWGKLTGTQPLPPRWALGNLLSRMAYRSQKETDSIVALMQQNNFPVDGVILDFYWFGDSIKGYLGRLDWYKPNWPDPVKMMADFKAKGIKTVLITEPYVIDSLENFKIGDSLGIFTTDSAGKTYINSEFYFGPAGLIDIFKPAARNWFWSKYKAQIENGVSGWWGDLGEPEYHPSDQFHVNGTADEVHNIYGHRWHRMLFDHYKKEYPKQRLFNLNRAGYAGSQRYSIFPWTGDVSRSWGGYRAQLPTLLHMSLSGLPYIHSDAGGFAQGARDDELYTRWLQFACFTPILRPHGQSETLPSEPVYFSKQTQDIVRKYMNLRYRLLPYIYSLSAQATLKGYPMMRPLFFEFPDDDECYTISNEYLFGSELLVAPVLKSGQKIRTVYLPKSTKWYDFHTNRKFPGGNEYEIPVTISDMPLFVKAGSFIPMTNPVKSTDNYSTKNLTVRYYMGKAGGTSNFVMYDDDGTDPEALVNGSFVSLMFVKKEDERGHPVFLFSKIGKRYTGMPETRKISFVIIGMREVKKAAFYKNNVKLKKTKPGKQGDGFYFDKTKKQWVVNFTWENEDVVITTKQK